MAFYGTESPTNLKVNYQYDPLGWVTSFGYSNNTAWGANIFTGSYEWIPASGDYDGDRMGDYGLYNRSTGEWELKLTSAGYAAVNLASFAVGAPVSADYDGDAKADPEVWQAQSGTWKVRLSSGAYDELVLTGLLGI